MSAADIPTEAAAFHAVDLIRTKRDGGEMSDAQIRYLIDGYTAATIPISRALAPFAAR